MRHRTILAAAAALSLMAGQSQAGVYSDDLSKCVVEHATKDDQVNFVRWFFSALSQNPSVSGMVSTTAAQRQDLNRQAVGLMERLLLKDCHKQSVAALKFEGEASLGASFQLFGQVAARTLMSDPAVEAELNKLDTARNTGAWEALAKEAGTAQ